MQINTLRRYEDLAGSWGYDEAGVYGHQPPPAEFSNARGTSSWIGSDGLTACFNSALSNPVADCSC